MRCKVLLFARIGETVGTPELAIDLPDGATVADALDRLAAEHPVIAEARPSLAVAVDEAYRPPAHALHDGCTVALIPPVSGG